MFLSTCSPVDAVQHHEVNPVANGLLLQQSTVVISRKKCARSGLTHDDCCFGIRRCVLARDVTEPAKIHVRLVRIL